MSLIKTNGNSLGVRSTFNDLFDVDNFFSSNIFDRELLPNVPAVNVKETNEGFEVQLAAPGYKKNDFKVSVDNETLNITAERKEEKNEDKDDYKRREFNYSSFSRSFVLPKTIKEEKIKAEYKEGILVLNIPKSEEVLKQSKKLINIE